MGGTVEAVLAIVVDDADNVATVTDDVPRGAAVRWRSGEAWHDTTAADEIPFGHKIALEPLAVGQPIRKYGETIGVARAEIEVGQHVHSHNLRSIRGQVENLEA